MNIIHVNHSSLLVSDNGCNLLTDPWYFTNAFEGWAPFPQPDARLIDDIIEGYYIPHIVLISHAHDDHLDERYLSKVPNKSIIVIPKLSGNSLKRRLLHCGIIDSNIVEVGTNPVNLFNYSISSISNHTLSKEDFIFTISTSSGLVIHANDNWLPFTGEVVNHILNLSQSIPSEARYLFAQVGVADAFPMFYSELSDAEKLDLITGKCNKMLSSLYNNGIAINAKHLFAYANQSLFSAPISSTINPYLAKDRAILSFQYDIPQLMPSALITQDSISNLYDDYRPLSLQRLTKFTSAFFEFFDSRIHKLPGGTDLNLLTIEFSCLEYIDLTLPIDTSKIQVISTLHHWNRILQGTCNLESIITGGCGKIRVEKSYNMRVEYNIMVDFSYFIQSQILSGKVFL